MSKGMIKAISVTGTLLLVASAAWAADIWKVVDQDGNVIYTDQPPEDGSAPMVLPEISVIETDIQVAKKASDDSNSSGDEEEAPTPRQLRNRYRDFHITRPLPEETFWGTGNSVVVTWGSKTPFTPDLTARLVVDGKSQPAPASGGVPLTLDRGEHKVYAELRDANNRRIAVTDTVTFFIKQNTVNSNRQVRTPGG